jgi:hypothetical protein
LLRVLVFTDQILAQRVSILTAEHAEGAEVFEFVFLSVLNALCGERFFRFGFAKLGVNGG